MPASVVATFVTTTVSQPSLSVGDRIRYDVNLMVPSGASVIPPPTEGTFGAVVVKDWNTSKTAQKNADSLNYNYIVTTYSQQCTIPALAYIVTAGNKTDTVHTTPLPLQVISIIPSDTVALKNLKPQQNAGKPSLLWLWILLAAAATGGLVYFRIKNHTKKTTEYVPPPMPPYEEAVAALKMLEEKKLPQQGRIRDYAFELSEILKRYIERQFAVTAAEFTTDEMIDWITSSPLETRPRAIASWFFNTTDPIKFAKLLPDQNTIQRFMPDIREFLELTRPTTTTTPVQPGTSHAV